MPTLAPALDDDLALSRRGVPTVGELGLLWFAVDDQGKTAQQSATNVRSGRMVMRSVVPCG